MPSGKFIPNPYFRHYLLGLSDDPPPTPSILNKGHTLQPITLIHLTWDRYGRRKQRDVTLGWVIAKKTSKLAPQHRIMTNCFGIEKDALIVRDRHILEGLAEVIDGPFTLVSNRGVRGIGLINWAVQNNCNAVYTPEGYDEYLLDKLSDVVTERSLSLTLITQIDGGVVLV
jgi:hypothetical protein